MEAQFQILCSFVMEKLEETGTPGAALGILHDDMTYSSGLGVTSIQHPLAVTDETLFQIGSITKTITALLMLQLADEGTVDLDEPIRIYLPDFRVQDNIATTQATIRHLLTHTAGWVGDVFIDTGSGDDAITRYLAEMAQLPQLVPMGAAVSYNNAGFGVCGAIIEAVTGQSYEDVLRERVLSPLTMDDACLFAKEAIAKRFAVGHIIMDNGSERAIDVAEPWELPRSIHAAGGLCCSVLDLLKYAWFQMGDGCDVNGQRLVSPESWRDLHTQQERLDSVYDGVGLSWFMGTLANEAPYYTHTGGTNGQISQLLVVPTANFAVAIFTNANRGREIIGDVVEEATRLFLNVQSSAPTAFSSPKEAVAELCGRYVRPHAELEIQLENDRLVFYVTPLGGFPNQDAAPPPAPPPARCTFYKRDGLVLLDGPSKHSRIDIVRLENGEIGWIRFGMRLHGRIS